MFIILNADGNFPYWALMTTHVLPSYRMSDFASPKQSGLSENRYLAPSVLYVNVSIVKQPRFVSRCLASFWNTWLYVNDMHDPPTPLVSCIVLQCFAAMVRCWRTIVKRSKTMVRRCDAYCAGSQTLNNSSVSYATMIRH